MKFLRFFSSVKLAIILIIIIVAVSVLGTLIPQGRSAAEYADRYGQLSGLMMKLQLTSLYRSAWYLALLGLFALNILVCTLTRLGGKLRKTFHPKVETEAKAMELIKSSVRFVSRAGSTETAAGVREELRSRHYRVRDLTAGGKVHLLGRKRVLGLFGADVVHLGLLVILAGGILSGLGGFRTYVSIIEGETAHVPEADFFLRLDRFETELYPDGSVRDWKSHLTVLENGREVKKKTVEVNHPLAHRGFMFYQNSYGADPQSPEIELWVRRESKPLEVSRAAVRLGQTTTLENDGLSLSFLRFVPDFVIGEGGEISSRSGELNNPAAFVELRRGPEKLLDGWVFAKYPEFAMMHSAQPSDYRVEFRSVRSNISVLEAARDPGPTVIWVGCGLLMAGLCLAFYWPVREIRFLLDENKGRTEVLAAAVGTKSREALAAEFEGLIKALRSRP